MKYICPLAEQEICTMKGCPHGKFHDSAGNCFNSVTEEMFWDRGGFGSGGHCPDCKPIKGLLEEELFDV